MSDPLESINEKLDKIIKRLGEGDVTLATLNLRVKIMELVVYGGIAIVLISYLKSTICF